eukprot:CAMPEP_0204121242 /NCGR_PEP_ID=MMETSP0361-20130328/8091_1 /ASSEMBLY_ACC=CAM_ASM_000343 /TAXON_ID=268821 /ORGANISM="Scrippsiella Hangoei, Strain SHTV-5" /LENGTH=273 /DNA_ID=CAMNT_0051072517 /DNA_START=1 /DNA_END=822 /DNA_ORIENTATION=+
MYECWSWDPHLPACLCDVGPAMVAAAVASAPLSICSGGPLPHPSLSVRGPRPASAGFAGLRRLGTQRAAPLGGALPHGTAASGSAERWRVITESRPTFRISVRLVPGGVLRGEHWLGCLQLTLPSRATAADVFRRLQEEGVRWAPPRPHPLEVALMLEECRLDERSCRFLFKGMPLKLDMAVMEQGVFEGSELKLIKSRVHPERLRCRSGHEPGAPRGLLLNPGAAPWIPSVARKGPEDFFDARHSDDRACFAHLSTLALAKVGKSRLVYLDT